MLMLNIVSGPVKLLYVLVLSLLAFATSALAIDFRVYQDGVISPEVDQTVVVAKRAFSLAFRPEYESEIGTWLKVRFHRNDDVFGISRDDIEKLVKYLPSLEELRLLGFPDGGGYAESMSTIENKWVIMDADPEQLGGFHYWRADNDESSPRSSALRRVDSIFVNHDWRTETSKYLVEDFPYGSMYATIIGDHGVPEILKQLKIVFVADDEIHRARAHISVWLALKSQNSSAL